MNKAENQSDLFLLLSNVAVVPATLIAVLLKRYASAALITTVAVVSFLYHSCQANFFCVVNNTVQGERHYYLMQKSDEFFVNVAIVWFVLYAIELGAFLSATVVFSLQGVFLLVLLSGSEYSTTILSSTIAVVTFFAFIYVLMRPKRLAFSIMPSLAALALLASGGTLFVVAGNNGEEKYWLYHSLWHVLLFLSVFFVLLIKTPGYSLILKSNK